jgi:hypothetical protein
MVCAWGKIDTGASRTVVPTRTLRQVGAYRHPRQVARCRAYDGTQRLLPVYEVNLTVDDPRWPAEVEMEFLSTTVVGISAGADAEDEYCEVLLGRDLIAAWRLHLDGRNNCYSVT